MKNIILFILINFVFIGLTHSQTRPGYVFDNFETKQGVQIVTQSSLPASPKENKQFVNKTAQTTSIVNDLSLKTSLATNVKLINKTVMSARKGLGEFTTGDLTIDSYIVESSARYNIDPLLIYAQMNQESAFKLKATSYKGASGLMQLMPGTAIRFGVKDIYNPKQNIEAGVKYMRWLLDKFGGDINLALAGYNAGEGAVMKYGYQIPPFNETQGYVKKITARYNSIKKPNSQKIVKTTSQQNVAELEKQQSIYSIDNELNAVKVRRSNGITGLVNR